MGQIIQIDDFEVGMLIMGMGLVATQVVLPTGDVVATQSVSIKFPYDNRVFKVLDTSILPYIVTELVWNEHNACIRHIQTPNLQHYQFRRIPQATLDILQGKNKE